jgi:RND family efflux transporter MFP subunit
MKKLWSWIKRKKWWLISLVVILVLAGGYYYRKQTAKPPVVTVNPQTKDITETLDVSGNIDAHELANLKFAAASKLTWLPVKEGDSVKKWQAIAAVDSRQLAKQMEIDQNLHGIQFRTTEQVLANNDYYGNSGLTESERRTVESSQLQTRNTALTVEYQDIAVKNATMVSPITGMVTKIDQPNVGATVMPTDVIQVVNPASIYFAVVVDEADIGKMKVGQEAEITLDAYPDEIINAKVEKIAFTPSQSQSGGLGYKLSLSLPVQNDQQQYRLGMSGDAKIVLNSASQVLSIPIDAITEREGKKYVDVLVNGVPEKREVTTGIDDGDYVEVTSGLTASDQVVMPTGTEK